MLDLYSGKTHTWNGPDGLPLASLDALTWASDSTTLAFNWSWPGLGTWSGTGAGLRLLDTTGGGRQLAGNSRLAVPVNASLDQSHQPRISVPDGMRLGSLMLAPGGRTAVAAETSMSDAGSGFARFSVRTGRLIGTFDQGPVASSGVLWSDPAGETLIVWSPPGHPGRLAIIRPGKVILLPAAAGAYLPYAAW